MNVSHLRRGCRYSTTVAACRRWKESVVFLLSVGESAAVKTHMALILAVLNKQTKKPKPPYFWREQHKLVMVSLVALCRGQNVPYWTVMNANDPHSVNVLMQGYATLKSSVTSRGNSDILYLWFSFSRIIWLRWFMYVPVPHTWFKSNGSVSSTTDES